MIINLKIPDSLYEDYLKQYGNPQHYKKMKDHLELLKDVPVNDRIIVLYGDIRKKIEAVFQCIIKDGEQLSHEINKLNKVKIQGIEIEFNPEELARIDAQAAFHGRSREVYLKEMLTEIKDTFLEKV
jgi:hypothetical protein